jgi:hypothetical protein
VAEAGALDLGAELLRPMEVRRREVVDGRRVVPMLAIGQVPVPDLHEARVEGKPSRETVQR